jgi:hypothetical protein
MRQSIFTYLVITPTGTSHEHHQRISVDVTTREVIRAAVGGGVDRVRVDEPGLALWCDEQGFVKALPANTIGSRLIRLLGGRAADYLGPIVVTGFGGDGAMSLTPEQVDHLLAVLRRCRGSEPGCDVDPSGEYAVEQRWWSCAGCGTSIDASQADLIVDHVRDCGQVDGAARPVRRSRQ